MTNFASRLAPRLFLQSLAALLLGCTALSAPASAWSLFGGDAKTDAASAKDAKAAPADNLDDSVRQAQMLRLSGNYDEAIHHLSQLMMVASDDPRVVSEYGKTLTAMGRASEAVQFLSRAQQLQPNEWTIYSAMGVSYDQLGNQKDAAVAYERALALKPGEPSVLTNYALSRMLASDPETAKKLIGRAEIAGAMRDAKLARNIALIRQMAPDTADHAYAVHKAAPAPAPEGRIVQASQARVAQAPEARVTQTPVVHVIPATPEGRIAQTAQAAPFVTLPASAAAATRNDKVVMQRVPVDPLAGPVAAASQPLAATHAPRTLFKPQGDTAKPDVKAVASAKPEAPVKSTDAQAQNLEAKAEAIAKTLAAKPQEKAAVMAKAMTPAPKMAAAAKPEAMKAPTPAQSQKTAAAPKPPVSVATAKPENVKPVAKPEPAKVAAAPKKDGVPALRLSANAY